MKKPYDKRHKFIEGKSAENPAYKQAKPELKPRTSCLHDILPMLLGLFFGMLLRFLFEACKLLLMGQ